MATPPRRFPLLPVVLLTCLALWGASPVAHWVTDSWWFASVGYADVFRTLLLTRGALALAAGALTLVVVGGSGRWAARAGRPVRLANRGFFATVAPSQLSDAAALLIGWAVAVRAWHAAPAVLLAYHAGPVGFRDPVFDFDAGFYLFALPVAELVAHTALWVALATGVVAASTYVAAGTVRVQLSQQDGQLVATGVVIPPEVRRHLATAAAAPLALWSVTTWLSRFARMSEANSLVTGPGYADLHGTLPLIALVAVCTAIAAFLVFLGIDLWRPRALVAAGVALIAPRVLEFVVPGLLQRFSVEPNQLSREGPQILHHIEATRFAFDLEPIEERPLSGVAELEPGALERNRATVDNVALWDHRPLLDAFSQVQEIRTYYGFGSVDNDRYRIDGQLRQVMSSPRELTIDALPPEAHTWVNETMTYTHGYGLALGPVNEVTQQGLPELFVRDVPPKVTHPDVFAVTRPELYFGEALDGWVVVGTDNPEFDFPTGDDNAYTHYQGADGVTLGRFGHLWIALREGSQELLFSGDVRADSRVLLYRNVVQRAARIVPILDFDSDPYLVVDGGRLVWMLDGYTRSARFPYAARVPRFGNYARNSVKVTIDAYDGTTRFYRTAVADPIADAWSAAFPGLLRPMSELPASLASHLRYPTDLFEAQAALFGTYHMQDHQLFYNREDAWEVPVIDERRMSPYHTILPLPGESEPEFVLMLPFVPSGKPNLAAWMVARNDGEHYGKLRVYKFPKDTMVYGPKMVVARINQDDAISEKLSLWGQQGSDVQFGTLMVIPIEGSLIYVQPLYIRASSGSIPELKRVIVAYQDRIAMTPTLVEGLERLFAPAPPTSPAPAEPGMAIPDVTSAELIRQLSMHWTAAEGAAARGDWATWGTHQQALGELISALAAGRR
ncbi:MAG: UPF0182 family protein [Myxococcota bacterium]